MADLGLASVLAELQQILAQEASAPVSEALVARKEAALGQLQSLLAAGLSPDEAAREAEGLKAVLTANSFNLKWSGMNARLGQIGQIKATDAAPTRPRLDLVH